MHDNCNPTPLTQPRALRLGKYACHTSLKLNICLSLFNTDPSGETNSIQVSLTPAAQCRAEFEPCNERRLAEQKSPVLTAQTTQPA